MRLFSNKVHGFVLAFLLIAAIGAIGVGYFYFQSNRDNNGFAINQDTDSTKPSVNSEDKKIAEATGTMIMTGDSEFGSILFDGSGQAIYIWELEESTKPECYGDCAEAWPPVLTDGAPIASAGVSNELLGTTERSDGTIQVTYNGHPLYYYAHEEPGEVKCHNIKTHGGLWWVIQPSGVRAE